ncbi:MAG: hypothetical protein JO250_13235 [Armatimonadetes bacterium]|nr:hypothetical protein [Armatimonadota bacterium]
MTTTRPGRARRLTLIKNAAANLARGGVAALVALLLPPFLVRAMPVERYAVWMLILQLSAYVAYLDFGIQTAVGRFVADAGARQDAAGRDRVVTTSLTLLAGAGALGLILIALLAWQMPHLFRALPPPLHSQARLALLLIGGSLAVGLPASAFTGVFVGQQRFELPAVIIAGGKMLGAFLLIAVVRQGGSLTSMATVIAAANVMTSLLLYGACRRFAAGIRIAPELASRRAAREIADYCIGLSVWQLGMLLVTGLDTTLVGIFQFPAVAYYSVAATLVMFIAGMQNMLFSVLMPEAAVMNARGDAKPLGEMLLTATRYGMFILLLTGVPLILAAKPILALWVGASYAAQATLLLQTLVVANVVRLAATPYAVLLVGTGQQRLVTISPLAEGFTNLLASVIGGALLGATGVALGTLIGAVVGLGCHILYNLPRTTAITIRTWDFVRDGLLRPLACAVPCAALVAACALLPAGGGASPAAGAACGLATLAVFWRWGLVPAERRRGAALLRPRRQALRD